MKIKLKLTLFFSLFIVPIVVIYIATIGEEKKNRKKSKIVIQEESLIGDSNSIISNEFEIIEDYIWENKEKFRINLENRISILQYEGGDAYISNEKTGQLEIDISRIKPDKFYRVQGAADISVIDYDSKISEEEPLSLEQLENTENLPDIAESAN